jgi:hypothetical protein
MSEVDLIAACAPKSDQLNADDLQNNSRTIKITAVKAGNVEQKIIVNFEGDEGKPWKPCKSMIRVMRALWGDTTSAWVGNSVTVYNDSEVKYGGVKVGGIRISHATGIQKDVVLALTATKGQRKPYLIRPLVIATAAFIFSGVKQAAATKRAEQIIREIDACTSQELVVAVLDREAPVMNKYAEHYKDLSKKVNDAVSKKQGELSNV